MQIVVKLLGPAYGLLAFLPSVSVISSIGLGITNSHDGVVDAQIFQVRSDQTSLRWGKSSAVLSCSSSDLCVRIPYAILRGLSHRVALSCRGDVSCGPPPLAVAPVPTLTDVGRSEQ